MCIWLFEISVESEWFWIRRNLQENLSVLGVITFHLLGRCIRKSLHLLPTCIIYLSICLSIYRLSLFYLYLYLYHFPPETHNVCYLDIGSKSEASETLLYFPLLLLPTFTGRLRLRTKCIRISTKRRKERLSVLCYLICLVHPLFLPSPFFLFHQLLITSISLGRRKEEMVGFNPEL